MMLLMISHVRVIPTDVGGMSRIGHSVQSRRVGDMKFGFFMFLL